MESLTKIKLGKQTSMIQALPAFDNSAVLLCRKEAQFIKQIYSIVHVDQEGQTLKEVIFNPPANSWKSNKFHMINEYEVIFLSQESQCNNESTVSILNLKDNSTKKVVTVPQKESGSKIGVQVFGQAKYILLIATGKKNIYLSYYKYNKFEEQINYTFEMPEKGQKYDICKADELSGVAIWTKKKAIDKDSCFDFTYLTLNEKNQVVSKDIQTENTFGQQFPNIQFDEHTFSFMSIKKIANHNFFVSTSAWPASQLSMFEVSSSAQQNSTYHLKKCSQLWAGMKEPKIMPRVRYTIIQAKLTTGENTSDLVEYYLDNETRKITAAVRHSGSLFVHLCEVGWNERIECCYEAEEVNGISFYSIGKCQVFQPKDMCIHLLLSSNQDFDDDLLQDALTLAGVIEK